VVYESGTMMYEMVSLSGSNQPPDPALFLPPPETMTGSAGTSD
jgi:hypothetical protein